MSRDWKLYVEDMIEFSRRVLSYVEGLDQEQFEKNLLVYDATVRNIELIGESATHIPEQVRLFAPHIEWRRVIATRNRLIHGYLGIDNDVLWSIICDDIPQLLSDLHSLRDATNVAIEVEV